MRITRVVALLARFAAAATLMLFGMGDTASPAQAQIESLPEGPVPHLVKDINTTGVSSDPIHLTGVGGTLFFFAHDLAHGHELWKSDGTEQGTLLVKDIYPGTYSSIFWNGRNALVPLDGVLYFFAADDTHGRELWKSDGTPEGTVRVKDIRPGEQGGLGNSSIRFEMVAVGGTLFFVADDGVHGKELWRSDGTPEGTWRVADLTPGGIWSDPGPMHLTELGGALYFTLRDQLWRSDGTALGTEPVAALESLEETTLLVAGDTLYFTVNDRELWRSDGTPAGTARIVDLATENALRPRDLVAMGGRLFFSAYDETYGRELWVGDGTAGSATRVADIYVGTRSGLTGANDPYDSEPFRPPLAVGGTLFFQANDGEHGWEMWASDGTEAGTRLLKDVFVPTSYHYEPYERYLTALEGRVFFRAVDGTDRPGMWAGDGTPAGTTLFKQIDFGGSDRTLNRAASAAAILDGTLFFRACDAARGCELWKSDGTPQGTTLVKDIYACTNGSYPDPSESADVDGTLFFVPDDGVHGDQLWKSDGTAQGTLSLTEFEHSGITRHLYELTAVGGTLFFEYDGGLWASDGTPAGTRSLGPFDGVGALTDIEGTLFFSGCSWALGCELWKSDGTPSGTVLVKDIRFGVAGSMYRDQDHMVEIDGTAFFIAAGDLLLGYELWKSDGTPEGTVMVKDIHPVEGCAENSLRYDTLVAAGGSLFFVTGDCTHGRELWVSDGTPAGTVMVEDIYPGSTCGFDGESPCSPEISVVGVAGGRLYFAADDGVHGRELWVSDGTPQGTHLVVDIDPRRECGYDRVQGCGSDPSPAAVLGDTLYFAAGDGLHGLELWKSDGTPEGTALVLDGVPGPEGSDLHDPMAAHGRVYYTADDGVHGRELWVSDGTAAGTHLVQDIDPGDPWVPDIRLFDTANDALYFLVTDGLHGYELWSTGSGSGHTIYLPFVRINGLDGSARRRFG